MKVDLLDSFQELKCFSCVMEIYGLLNGLGYFRKVHIWHMWRPKKRVLVSILYLLATSKDVYTEGGGGGEKLFTEIDES